MSRWSRRKFVIQSGKEFPNVSFIPPKITLATLGPGKDFQLGHAIQTLHNINVYIVCERKKPSGASRPDASLVFPMINHLPPGQAPDDFQSGFDNLFLGIGIFTGTKKKVRVLGGCHIKILGQQILPTQGLLLFGHFSGNSTLDNRTNF